MVQAGYTVWRSSLDANAHYVHIQHEHDRMRGQGGAHEHADPLSFMLYAYGEPLAIDPGYLDYSRHNLVKHGRDHNIILVDGEGPAFPFEGLAPTSPMGDAWAHDSVVSSHHKALAASSRYRFTEVRRRYLELRFDESPLRLFLTSELMLADKPQHYTYALNGLASELIPQSSFESEVLSEHSVQAVWTRPKASLHYLGGPSEGSVSLSSRLEESTHALQKHRTLDVSATMGESVPAAFLSVLLALPTGEQAPAWTLQRPQLGLQVMDIPVSEVVRVQAVLNGHTHAQTYLGVSYPSGWSITVSDGPQTRHLHFPLEMPDIPMPDIDL